MSKQKIDLYKQHHLLCDWYGASGVSYLKEVSLVIDYLKPKVVLDYGCGKGALIKVLAERYPHIKFYGYDPAILGMDNMPVDHADLVLNTDVLEHIPEDDLIQTIQKISKISKNVFFALDHCLAGAILPNGENAHCCIRPREWYVELICRYFPAVTSLDSNFKWKSVVLTFGVKAEFFNQYYQILQGDFCKKQGGGKAKQIKYKILSMITFGSRRLHYKKKLQMFN